MRHMRRFLCFLFTGLALILLTGCKPPAAQSPSPTPPADSSAVLPAPSPPLPEGSQLTAHFIDVGQADATLFLCDGQAMLVDGGNAADSDLIYAYLKDQQVSHLDYMVCTHAHEDHVGGLAGALNACTVGTIYAPVNDYDSDAFRAFQKYAGKQNVPVTIPPLDSSFSLGSATVQILGPRRSHDQTNNTSIILKVVFGKTSFLLTGDAEREAEQDLLDADVDLSATVYQAGHHGSDTSTSYPFLRAVMPQYAVISVGAGNAYGHPDNLVLSRLRDAEAVVYRTDLQGHIVAHSDGRDLDFITQKNPGVQTNPTQSEAGSGQNAQPPSDETPAYYIGNRNTKKFHRPSCSSLPQPQNRVTLDSRQQAEEQGYAACKICKP